MFEKKHLMINCDVLDTRRIKEEDYAGYEKIVANADLVLVSEASKSILARLPVTMNHDKTIELPADAPMPEIRTINSSAELSASTPVSEHAILTVNGALRILPGAGDALKHFDSITINGVVECPESLAGYLGKMDVNGASEVYPDDCVLLKRNFMLDEYFPVRAKADTRYYARRITFKNAAVDIAPLAQKNVRFVCKRFLVPEELLEAAVPLFDERSECIVVPRGMTLIDDDVVLSDALLRKRGTKLFVYGDVSVDPDDRNGDALKKLEKLIVKGTLSVTKRQEEILAEIDAEYDELEVTKGRRIGNKVKVRVDSALLDSSEDGVAVLNAAKVVLAEDITAETILDKLEFKNIAKVDCTEAQESAVAAVSENVAKIGGGSDETDAAADDPIGMALGKLKDAVGTKFINADSYVM